MKEQARLGRALAAAPVICCRSKEKHLHCQPGDILVDDWEKYRHLWVGAGGIWITHRSAKETVELLREHLPEAP